MSIEVDNVDKVIDLNITNISTTINNVVFNNNIVINTDIKLKRKKKESDNDIVVKSVKKIHLSYYTDDLFLEYLKNIYIQFKDAKKRYKKNDFGCEKKYLGLFLGSIIAYNTGIRINELTWLSYSDIKKLFDIDDINIKDKDVFEFKTKVISVVMDTKKEKQQQRLLKVSTELLKKIREIEDIKYDYFMSLFNKYYNNIPDKKYNMKFFINYKTLTVLDKFYFIKIFNKSIRDFVYTNISFVSKCLKQTHDIDPDLYKFSSHDFFRRTFIHKAAASGKNVHIIAKAVHHRSWQTTAHYLANWMPNETNYSNFIESINLNTFNDKSEHSQKRASQE